MENHNSGHIIDLKRVRDFIRNPNLTPLEKCLLLNLYFYAGTTGTAFPSQKTLANDFGYKDSRHIRTYLNKLKEKRLLSWKKRGYSKSNSYILNGELYFRNDKIIRKPTSAHLGTILPVQNGTPLPSKVSQESNQLSSSNIQQLFEETSKKKLNSTEIQQIYRLCNEYTEGWVEEAIKLASKRKISFLSVKYISLILGDWKKDGKPLAKPNFLPCEKNGCENGYIFNSESQSYNECDCREIYKHKLEDWKKNEQ